MKSSIAKNVLLLLTSIGFCVIGLEIIVRIATPGIGFTWRNFTYDPIDMIKVNQSIQFDSELGYVLAPNGPGIGPYGFRPNDPADIASPSPGQILAVGDSFTFGSQVLPEETWPAQLERMLAKRVINGGIGGYGIDQTLLYAERLVPQYRPKTLIFSFIPDDVDRAEMSVFSGANKPYFTLNDTGLNLHNVPVPSYKPSWQTGWLRGTVGYSYLVTWAFDRLKVGDRWRLPRWENVQVDHDGARVACRLMVRLAGLARDNDTAVFVVAQYAWSDFTAVRKAWFAESQSILECAKSSGLLVIDTFPTFQERLRTPEDFKTYYVNGTGHMTTEGNRLVATMIADRLHKAGTAMP